MLCKDINFRCRRPSIVLSLVLMDHKSSRVSNWSVVAENDRQDKESSFSFPPLTIHLRQEAHKNRMKMEKKTNNCRGIKITGIGSSTAIEKEK